MRHTGFSLLEVLIALVVFSLGLIGLGSLQLAGLQLSQDSLLRTKATILANDMADRIRSNPTAVSYGAASPYNNPTGAATANPNCLGLDSAGAWSTTTCDFTQMAQHDFFEWQSNIAGTTGNAWYPEIIAQLPSGVGIVCIDSTPNDGTPSAPACDGIIPDPNNVMFTIKIWWKESKDGNTAYKRYVMSFAP